MISVTGSGVSPDAVIGTPLGIFPGLLGDFTFAAAGPPFVPAGPLPDVEGAFGLAALCGGARPACPCTSLWTGVLDLVREDGVAFLTGSAMVFYLIVVCVGKLSRVVSVEFLS
jgi:hypothetical protein